MSLEVYYSVELLNLKSYILDLKSYILHSYQGCGLNSGLLYIDLLKR